MARSLFYTSYFSIIYNQMKKNFFPDNFYSIAVIAYNGNTGKNEFQRISVISISYSNAVKKARCETNYHQFEEFLRQHSIFKLMLHEEYAPLKKWEINYCYTHAALRVFNMAVDCRSINTEALLRKIANRIVADYVMNKRQQ